MKTVLVSGDRNWQYYGAIEGVLKDLAHLQSYWRLIHGAARGADSMADLAGHELGMDVTPVPADWKTHGRAAGPIRNRKMLDMKPDLVVAFHNNLEKSRGTKDCVVEARLRGIPVILVTHTETYFEPDAIPRVQARSD